MKIAAATYDEDGEKGEREGRRVNRKSNEMEVV